MEDEANMKECEYESIRKAIGNYKHTSMRYTDYEDICDYDIVCNTEQLILLCGYNKTAKLYEYVWAANTAGDIINLIEKEQCFITFIPYEWIGEFEKAGFSIRNAWHDYFKNSLSDINDEVNNAVVLKDTECEEASEVTMCCRNKSRGYTGETKEFISDWLNGKDENNRNSTIFIEKNDLGEIIGLACTSTYAHGNEKGPIAWIREVCVRPEYQNRGIARKLIMQALLHGKMNGAKRAFLAVDEMNEKAIHLYKSLGFEPSTEESQVDMIK